MTSSSTVRTVGLLTFFLGVILLLLVFFQARADLARPLSGNPAQMGALLARQIGLLFIMGFVGSSLAGRGVQMYGAGNVKTVVVDDTVDVKTAG
jgi:hypothetical protein